MHPVCAMIALISDQGLVFGTVVGISPRRLRMEVAAELRADAELEWRMELTGLPDTAMGWLQVRGSPAAEGGLVRYDADILRVSTDDRELFELWVDGVLNHHIVATRPRDSAGPFGAAATMQGTTPGERAAVVRRMEEQRKSRSKRALEVLAAGKKRWPSPEDEAGGRRAVAAAWSPMRAPEPTSAGRPASAEQPAAWEAAGPPARPPGARAAALQPAPLERGAPPATPALLRPAAWEPVRATRGSAAEERVGRTASATSEPAPGRALPGGHAGFDDLDPVTRPLPAAPPPERADPRTAPHLRFEDATAPTLATRPVAASSPTAPTRPEARPAAHPAPAPLRPPPAPAPRAPRPLPPPPPPDPATRPALRRDVVWEPNTRPTLPVAPVPVQPAVLVDQIAGHCFVTLTWPVGCEWEREVVPALETGLYTVSSRALGAPGTAVRVVLKRPDGGETRASAEIRQVSDAGSTLRFLPPGLDRRWLVP